MHGSTADVREYDCTYFELVHWGDGGGIASVIYLGVWVPGGRELTTARSAHALLSSVVQNKISSGKCLEWSF